MYRHFRMRRYNPNSISGKFDVLFPQTITDNILRSNDAGVLESDLLRYDRHLDSNIAHLNRALSDGTARALFVQFKNVVLRDNFPLLLTLHTNLECEPTLQFNDGEPHEIISASGDRIPGGQIEGSVIFLVWKERLQKWLLISSDNFTDVTKIVLPVESEYVYTALTNGEVLITIPGFNKKSDKLVVNYCQTVLRSGIDFEFDKTVNDTIRLLGFSLDQGEQLYFTITTYITSAKRGHYRYELKPTDHAIKITSDNVTEIELPPEVNGAHSVIVNYYQTVLRNNLDYVYSDDRTKIVLKNLVLNTGDVIVLTITQFVEAPGELVPNNWGATGNYRYSLNVVHTSYSATEDNVTVITVPSYDYKRDEITVIRNNKLYVYDVDYTIDEIGNVVLLKDILNTGDEIFFTIMQGAMMDVPNFNVIRASGQDGQHILLDMSYTVLCNYYTLLIQLKHDLKDAPTLKCIDGPAEPIRDCYGMPILGGYRAGSFLWVVYDESTHTWYSMSHSQIDISQSMPTYRSTNGVGRFTGAENVGDMKDYREAIIPHNLGMKPTRINIVPCEPPFNSNTMEPGSIGDVWAYADITNIYVGNSGDATSKFSWTASIEEETNDIKGYIRSEVESLRREPGRIIPHLSTYTAENDGEFIIDNIANFHAGVDKLVINLYQTVLRPDIDYKIRKDTNGIELVLTSLNKGDILQFIVLEQVEILP